MKIYRKIDETVKMHTAAIKVYILVVFYCFRPINAILGSFDVLSSHLLRRRQGKTRLSYAARRKSSKTYLQSTPIAPKLRLSTDRRFSFLENVNLVPDIGQWPQKDEKCDKKFELSASVDTLFFGVYYRWPLLGSWLSCLAERLKSPRQEGSRKTYTNTNQIHRSTQRTLSFYKGRAGKTRVPV